jgi:hypothetical protein
MRLGIRSRLSSSIKDASISLRSIKRLISYAIRSFQSLRTAGLITSLVLSG